VSKIHDLSGTAQWRHVPGDMNPADHATRSDAVRDDAKMSVWFSAPAWLSENSSMWPEQSAVASVLDSDPEVRPPSATLFASLRHDGIFSRTVVHYRSFNKMVRAIGYLVRFIRWCGVKNSKDRLNLRFDPLTAAELSAAKVGLIKYDQSQTFSGEISMLKCGKPLVKQSSDVYDLLPVLDAFGVLRVGGRIRQCQVLLSRHSALSDAVIYDYHEKCGHRAANWTLSEVRRNDFWLVHGFARVKSFVKKCAFCRRYLFSPVSQRMAVLPDERITPGGSCFEYTGCDCFGPIVTVEGRKSRKRYAIIFTCLRSRAVHLEYLNDMNADSCISSIRRFVNLRGKPKKIFSDNGRNFVRAEKEMKQCFNKICKKDLPTWSSSEMFDWCWLSPYSPWKAGVWERLISIIKSILRCIMKGDTGLSDEGLRTFLSEVSAIMNNRPLTKLTDDPLDFAVLTPAHLMHLASDSAFTPGQFGSADVLRCRWKRVQFMVQKFWESWVRFYLPELQKFSKWHTSYPNLKVGDLVLVVDIAVPRNLWPLARVTEVKPGCDGKVRSVLVITQAGSQFERPVKKLVLLEADLSN
jgi:hypothetical protein